MATCQCVILVNSVVYSLHTVIRWVHKNERILTSHGEIWISGSVFSFAFTARSAISSATEIEHSSRYLPETVYSAI